jgi:hypothetical protein
MALPPRRCPDSGSNRIKKTRFSGPAQRRECDAEPRFGRKTAAREREIAPDCVKSHSNSAGRVIRVTEKATDFN